MTLITRLITNNRTIFLSDGRITSNYDCKIKTDTAQKLIKLSNGIIGLSGATEFGEWSQNESQKSEGKREFKVFDNIKEHILSNNYTILNSLTAENIFQNLKDCINKNHSGINFSNGPRYINILISFKLEKMNHSKVIVNRTAHNYHIEYLPRSFDLDSQKFDFDTNLKTEKGIFLKLLNDASNHVFKKDLNDELINSMGNDDIKKIGIHLYRSYLAHFNNPKVGPFFMFETF